jgi:hypothetical protein
MRRTLAVVAMFVGCFTAPTAKAQDGRQVLEGILGGVLSELERRQQERRQKKLWRQLEPLWNACAAGDVSACEAAGRFPLSDQARADLHENLHRAIAKRDAFDRNSYQCQHGNVEACDHALAYPFATNHQILHSWRHAAVERERERREPEIHERQRIAALVGRCHAGDLSSCDAALSSATLDADERVRISATRVNLLNRRTTPSDGSDYRPQGYPKQPVRSAPARHTMQPATPQPASGSAGSPLLAIIVTALLAAAFVIIKRCDLSFAPLSAYLSPLFRPQQHHQREESRVMLDDRERLLGSMRSGLATPPPIPHMDHVRVMRPGQDKMKVKIRRDQVTGITGSVTFTVHFIAELSPEAREAVRRYGFGKTVLYYKDPKLEMSMNLFRLLWRMLWLRLTRKRWQINVNDLVNGRTIQCKDILEVLEVEDRVMGAAKSFASVLRAASWFGGEEIVAL